MRISFSCSQCGKSLTAKESMAGRQLACPNCQAPIRVPEAEKQPEAIPADVKPIDTTPTDEKKEEKKPSREHPLLLVSSVKSHPDDLIDMTAMVDIVFFLLIFFLVTSLQAVEAVINLPKPEPTESAAPSVQTALDMMEDSNNIVVTIDQDDGVWVEGKETYSEQELRSVLREAQQTGVKPDSMLVLSHPEATSGAFVMVLDAGADAGIKKLSFSVEEDSGGEGGN